MSPSRSHPRESASSSRLRELLEDLCRKAGIGDAMHEVVETHDVEVEGICLHLDADAADRWLEVTALFDAPSAHLMNRAALMQALLAHAFESRADPDSVRFSVTPDESGYAATLLLPFEQVNDSSDLLALLSSAAELVRDEFDAVCVTAALAAQAATTARPAAQFQLYA